MPVHAGRRLQIRRCRSGSRAGGGNLIYASIAGIHGYLGRFEIMLAGPNGPVGPGEVTTGRRWVDIVLDLTTPGFISGELPPIGYYAPAHDPIELERAPAEIPELGGSFERSGIRACTRCLDACSATAITSLGERIEIDPNLCQGAGAALRPVPPAPSPTAYPWLGDTLEKLRAALRAYREAGGNRPGILFHDAGAGQVVLTHLASPLPGYVIPVESEEIGSVGMDIWLAAITYEHRSGPVARPARCRGISGSRAEGAAGRCRGHPGGHGLPARDPAAGAGAG